MGLIICKKHGETGVMPFVSKGLYDCSRNNADIKCSDIKTISIEIKIDDEYSLKQSYYFTADEYKKYSLNDYYVIQTEEDDEKLSLIFNDKFHPVCGKCFNEYLSNMGCAELR